MTSTEVDQFLAGGGAPPAERVNGRYKMVGPDGEEHSYQTASNYAFPLTDQFGLNRWRMRQLLIGVSQRPDLLALLATMTEPDIGKLDEAIKTAMEVAGTTKDANLGTAVHSALQAADEGKPYPPEYASFVDYYREALAHYGLRVVLTERLVVAPELGAAGRLDRVFEEADGTLVIGDVKTSGRLDMSGHEISVQLAVYQGASHVRDADGRSWISLRDGRRVRDDYAIVVHVDRETGAVAMYRVDLIIGRHGANLAEQVRGWRKSGPVLLPYVPPTVPLLPPQGVQVPFTPTGLGDAPAAPQTGVSPFVQAAQPEIDRLNEQTRQAMADAMTVMQGAPQPLATQIPVPRADVESNRVFGPTVTGPPADSWAHPDNLHNDQPEADPFGRDQNSANGTGATGTTGTSATPAIPVPGAVSGSPGGTDLKTGAELMKPAVTKAQVQQYCREHGITDLAHTKKVLVELLAKAGKLAAPGSQPAATSATPSPVTLPAAENPKSDVFRRLQLGRLKAANTVGEMETIRLAVVKAGGDQAWTDEMVEAARDRVTELDAATQEGRARVLEPDPVGRIAQARTSEDLGRIWEEVTIGNAVPGNWTPALHAAATARLDEINNARPPAPSNPFVGSAG